MTISTLKNFYKKKILLIMTIIIISSILLSNLSVLFINKQSLPVIQINQEKIYPEILKLNFHMNKKKKNHHIKKMLSTTIKEKEYEQYLLQKTVIKIINACLLRQYIDTIHLDMLNKYSRNIIRSSKYFKINHKFDYTKYFKFINFLMYTNNQYINLLKKKIAVKYLINILLNSIFILKKEIKNQLKNTINRKNIQIIKFKSHLKKIKNKNKTLKIKKNIFLKKNKTYNPTSIKIKIACIKKKINFHHKINDNHLQKYCNNKIKDMLITEYYNYHYIHTNTLQTARNIINNFQEKKPYIQVNNEIKKNKNFNYTNLGWINKKNIPLFLKKCQLKKKTNSKIIFYKKNFFIFKLHNIKKIKNKNIYFLKHNMIEKIKKNYFILKKIILKNQFNNFLKNKNIQLEKLLPKKKTKMYITKNINYKNVLQYSYSNCFNNYIKKNFFLKNSIHINPDIKIYKNTKNHIYLLQIHSQQSFSQKKNTIINNKILNFSKKNQLFKKKYLHIKKFMLKKKNKKTNYLKKNAIHFYKTTTISNQQQTEIIQLINQLPSLKKNNYIYFPLPQSNNQNKLVIFKNSFFKKINKTEKYIIIQQIKQYCKIKIISTILKDLYKKSKITYNSNIDRIQEY